MKRILCWFGIHKYNIETSKYHGALIGLVYDHCIRCGKHRADSASESTK